jgi:hypothetical protein
VDAEISKAKHANNYPAKENLEGDVTKEMQSQLEAWASTRPLLSST